LPVLINKKQEQMLIITGVLSIIGTPFTIKQQADEICN